jgi:hypothetical protein
MSRAVAGNPETAAAAILGAQASACRGVWLWGGRGLVDGKTGETAEDAETAEGILRI